ncbi:MAG: hypothetical protein OEL69_06685 [Nitrosopumilus sp.]|nr:hypothetical protein [Nitrosopumilus sp.]
MKSIFPTFYKRNLGEMKVCKSRGDVFSKKAGVTNITECPQCKGINFEQITLDTDLEYKEVSLDELD